MRSDNHFTALLAAVLISSLCFVAFAQPTFADSPPVPQKKIDALTSIDYKNFTQKNIKEMQEMLVDISNSIQKNESTMESIDEQIEKLQANQTELQSTLEKDRGEMADLLLALQRLRRMPPEALIAKPDAPLKTAQSAMLLENTLPSLYKKAETLKINLEKNAELTASLKSKREQASITAKALQKQHSTLSALVQKRKNIYRSTQKGLAIKEQRNRKIAAHARTLKDLVKNLEENNKSPDSVKQTASAAKPAAIPGAGSARLPISGVIKTRYNEPDHFGAPSQGIDIEGRGGALVVAPMGGVIRFSGHFKNYGNMVIIEHEDGYHSLVAGLEKIDTVVGQNIIAGEPLGLLHYEGSRSDKPVLYYELRYNGKAVNPAKKFSDLG